MRWIPIKEYKYDGEVVIITDGSECEVGKNYGSGWIDNSGLDFAYGQWDEEITHFCRIILPK